MLYMAVEAGNDTVVCTTTVRTFQIRALSTRTRLLLLLQPSSLLACELLSCCLRLLLGHHDDIEM